MVRRNPHRAGRGTGQARLKYNVYAQQDLHIRVCRRRRFPKYLFPQKKKAPAQGRGQKHFGLFSGGEGRCYRHRCGRGDVRHDPDSVPAGRRVFPDGPDEGSADRC